MTIQETIIEALKASQSAHSRALATIAGLRSEKSALEAEQARLNAQIASLRSQVAHLEAECEKIVEPGSVQALLGSVLQLVEETQHATTPAAGVASGSSVAAERLRPEDVMASAPPLVRPILPFQQRPYVDRDVATYGDAVDVAR